MALALDAIALPFLRTLFGDAVLQPIRLHVDAKRYCARVGTLQPRDSSTAHDTGRTCQQAQSAASNFKGGIFIDSEAQRFISQPHAEGAVRVRLWDDAAKIENAETPPLCH